MAKTNPIKDLLMRLNIIDPSAIIEYFPNTRDRKDVSVLKCTKSGVIFLSGSEHMTNEHYEAKSDLTYWSAVERKEALRITFTDDDRRKNQFLSQIRSKKWVDIGTGLGGILDLIGDEASEIVAVEPQQYAKKCLEDLNYKVFSSSTELYNNYFEVVTLFHVLEHFIDPLEELIAIKSKLKSGGKIIVEIPHANDFLISFLELQKFKEFTFWSEHLILHTRDSIRVLLEAAGFRDVVVKGYQRYPLSNHFHWISKGRPGGHELWSELNSDQLEQAYSNLLNSMDKTDTLIVTAVNT